MTKYKLIIPAIFILLFQDLYSQVPTNLLLNGDFENSTFSASPFMEIGNNGCAALFKDNDPFTDQGFSYHDNDIDHTLIVIPAILPVNALTNFFMPSGHTCGGVFRHCIGNNGTAQSDKGTLSMVLTQELLEGRDYILKFKVARFNNVTDSRLNRSPDLKLSLSENANSGNKKDIVGWECHHNGGPNWDEWYQFEFKFTCPAGDLDWINFSIDNACLDIGIVLQSTYYTGYLFDEVELYEECDYVNSYYNCSVIGGGGLDLLCLAPIFHDQNSPWHLSVGPEVIGMNINIYTYTGQTPIRSYELECLNGYFHNLYWDGKSQSGSEVASGTYRIEVGIANTCDAVSHIFTVVKLNTVYSPTVLPVSTTMQSACDICLYPIPRYNDCCLSNFSISNYAFLCPPPYPVEYVVQNNVIIGPNVYLGDDVELNLSFDGTLELLDVEMGDNATVEINNVSCRTSSNNYWPLATSNCYEDTLKLIVSSPDTAKYSIFWITPDSTVIDSTYMEYLFTSPGNYTFTIGIINKISNDTTLSQQLYQVQDCSSSRLTQSNNKVVSNKISLFPNPNNGKFYIQFPEVESHTANLDIYSIQGKLIYKKILTDLSSQTEINLPVNINSGLYFCKLHTNSSDEMFRLEIVK